MNWIFDTYSNVYTTAMMQDQKSLHHEEPFEPLGGG